MAKILTILILSLATAGQAFGAGRAENQNARIRQPKPFPFITEGFALVRIEGTVTRTDEGGKWFFAADKDITDGRGLIAAGSAIELLPSSTLEKIASYAGQQTSAAVRLQAWVTRYSNRNLLDAEVLDKDAFEKLLFDRNYLFPTLFIPMTQRQLPQTEADKTAQADEPRDSAADKSNAERIIPADVMKMLKPKRVPNLAKLKEVLETESDVAIVDRTGFIIAEKEGKVLKLDGLGRNVENISFRLLPCEALERIEKKQSRAPGRQRFRVAGIVTKYKNDYYLLLQRAVRTYSHGNFAR